MTKSDLVFETFESKYCSWWARRIDTDDKYNSEREQWRAALRPYSFDQVKRGLGLCRRYHQFRPPFPHEFVLLIDKSENPQPVSQTNAAKKFFSHAREVLR